MHEIGSRISALRKQRDMTQLELADKMGVSYQAVSGWERGSTMPDISRLPEISQILAVSIDELLGNDAQAEIVKNVLTRQTNVYTSDNRPHIDDVAEVAPILKPSQIDDLVEKVNPTSMKELTMFAPFLSKSVLRQLALDARDAGDMKSLSYIAPFLDKDMVDQLAYKIEAEFGMSELKRLAPFISKEALNDFAAKAIGSGSLNELKSLAPFLDSELLDKLVLKAIKFDKSARLPLDNN